MSEQAAIERERAVELASEAVLRAARVKPTLGELIDALCPPRPFNERDLSEAVTSLAASGAVVLDGDQRLVLPSEAVL